MSDILIHEQVRVYLERMCGNAVTGRSVATLRDAILAHDAALRAQAQARVRELEGTKFWESVYPDGMTAEQVKDELIDYHMILDNVSKVYDHVTGGKISKANTDASAVIAEYHDDVTRMIEEEMADLQAQLAAMTHERDALKAQAKKLMDKYDGLVEGCDGEEFRIYNWVISDLQKLLTK